MSEDINFRNEALGAFAHEFRTPLTAIKMVMELGRRAGDGDTFHLDADVAGMLGDSVGNLETLADGIQALSWLERGKLNLESGPCDLAAAVSTARKLLGETVRLETVGVEGITGPWDTAHLPRALASVVEAAARCGAGDVSLAVSQAPGGTTVTVSSGGLGGDRRPVNADLGFAFYVACLTLEYGNAAIRIERASRFLKVEIVLPG